jgi:hypothetical protein
LGHRERVTRLERFGEAGLGHGQRHRFAHRFDGSNRNDFVDGDGLLRLCLPIFNARRELRRERTETKTSAERARPSQGLRLYLGDAHRNFQIARCRRLFANANDVALTGNLKCAATPEPHRPLDDCVIDAQSRGRGPGNQPDFITFAFQEAFDGSKVGFANRMRGVSRRADDDRA